MMTDTKAYWKRRALKAEHELESLSRIRKFEHNQEFELARVNAAMATAFREIEDALLWARDQNKTIGV